ncbi:MAG TPA: hypothetical protein VFO11_11155 [Candidatus Polarisedimenticolaceae bacterium]|nr:hypothetical protein [Candidatus Polarisedimenticolaceae bacterium]
MLEGVPRTISVFRETPAGRILPWAVVIGAIVFDLITLRESQDQRIVIVIGFLLGSLIVYGLIRLLIGRGTANERVHYVCVQLAGFLILFLGIVAIFALARAATDRAFAATAALFHGSWALGALDGYRKGSRMVQAALQDTPPVPPDPEGP